MPKKTSKQVVPEGQKESNYSWTIEQEDTLIDLWEEADWLYHFQKKMGVTRERRLRAYTIFGREIDVPADEVERHLHTLRTNYGRWTKGDTKSGSAAPPKNPRHVALMNRLHFLAPHIRTKGRQTLSSLDDSVEPEEQQESQATLAAVSDQMGGGDAGTGNVADEDMNAADGVDDVSVLGAGFDDDLTEQDKGEQEVVELEDDEPEVVATPRRQTRSAQSSCHDTAPLATKRGRKKKAAPQAPVVVMHEENTNKTRDGGKVKSTPIVMPMSISKGLESRQKPLPSTSTATGGQTRATLVEIHSDSEDADRITPVKRPAPATDVNPSTPAKRPTPARGKKVTKNVTVQPEDRVDIAAERLKVVQRMAQRIEGETEQDLWGKMIIKRLERLDEDTRDELMQHISVITMQAVRGKWRPKANTTAIGGLPTFMRSNTTASAHNAIPPQNPVPVASQTLQPIATASVAPPSLSQPLINLPTSYTSSHDDFQMQQQEYLELRRLAGLIPPSPSGGSSNPVFCQNYNRITGRNVDFEEM